MDDSLRIQRDLISLEARNPVSALKALTGRLPNFVASIKDFVLGTLGGEEAKVSLVNTSRLERKFRTYHYADASALAVYVPPGLNVTYLEYLKALELSQDIVDGLMRETLEPFNQWLAKLLTNPEGLSTIRATVRIPGFKEHDLNRAKKEISKCFSKNNTTVKRTYGDVIERHSDLPLVSEGLNKLNERLGKIRRKDLIKKVTEITQSLDLLLERTKQDPETYKVSGATMSAISKLAYTVGEEVEFYSVYSFQLQALTQAVEDSIERLRKVVK